MKNLFLAEGFLPNDAHFDDPKTDNNKYSVKVMFTVPVTTQEAYGDNPAKTSFENTFVIYAGSEKQAEYFRNNLKKGNFVSVAGRYTGSKVNTNENGETTVSIYHQIDNGRDLTIVPYTKKASNGQSTATASAPATAPTPTETQVKEQVASAPAADTGLPWA